MPAQITALDSGCRQRDEGTEFTARSEARIDADRADCRRVVVNDRNYRLLRGNF